MTPKKILIAILLCLMFNTCKKTEDHNSVVITADKLANILTVENKAIEVYGNALATTHDSVFAINTLGQWLLDQPDVKEAYYWSTAMVEIHFQNGLNSFIAFVKGDASGHHFQRGAGGGGNLKRFGSSSATAKVEIRNNKVLILNPFLSEFYGNTYPKKPQFEGGVEEMDVTVLNDNQVTYSVLNTLNDYGLVFLNTHGFPNGFVLSRLFDVPVGDSITNWTREQVLDALVNEGNIPVEKFESSELILDMLARIDGYTLAEKTAIFLVSEKFIRNSSLNMEGAVVFGNYCHSGYTASGPTTNNMPEAWRSKGVSAYYGYAFPNGSSSLVWETFATAMEDTLIRSLVHNGDTTGVAHLANNKTKLFDNTTFPDNPADLKLLVQRGMMFQPVVGVGSLEFTQFFDKNYLYEKCGDTLTDARDGQKYSTVCIGDQLWMAENLNWAGAGRCYDDNLANCDTYGRMYQWGEANHDSTSTNNPSGIQGVCLAGWHMPSENEWGELIDYLGGRLVAGGKMKSTNLLWSQPNEGATNSSGFSAFPGGYMDSSLVTGALDYKGIGSTAIFWSSTEEDDLESYRRSLRYDWNEVAVGSISRIRWMSVRCVKD